MKNVPVHYKRKVRQYDKQGHFIKEWDGISDIVKATGYSSSNIYQCCQGKIRQAYGYRWSFI